MGLDMYLTGEKFLWTDWKKPENNAMEDGFRVEKRILELGYWRKHPDLHGYIIKTFANGVDNCQDIPLTEDDLLNIIGAVESEILPKTSGFFFGSSSPDDKPEDLKILHGALDWLRKKESGVSKDIYYRASW